jgi:hypothetical protein
MAYHWSTAYLLSLATLTCFLVCTSNAAAIFDIKNAQLSEETPLTQDGLDDGVHIKRVPRWLDDAKMLAQIIHQERMRRASPPDVDGAVSGTPEEESDAEPMSLADLAKLCPTVHCQQLLEGYAQFRKVNGCPLRRWR